ncbi:hypothetical protein IEQ34_011461 [Dendrobium chrysotoxum]|uniref:Uncharacterized protein n=1 Tax=Dendrobium chrysotoxum TaxID=161865 RepID=A0AAV7GRC1_DENCH|nr:hypothetical protein IEQ34_011461 [Dendrobium chrysotoxum]
MIQQKILPSTPRSFAAATSPTNLLPKSSSSPSRLPKQDEAVDSTGDQTSGGTSPRISPKASPNLTRWSRARALRSGRGLSLRNKTPSTPVGEISPSISSDSSDGEEDTAATPRADGKPIYMVSDGTGWTAEHSVNTALGQFEHCLVDRGCPINTQLFSGISMIGGQTQNPCFAPGIHSNSGSAKVFQSKFQMVNSSEFDVLLRSCIDSRSLKQGRELHVKIREAGLERNSVLLPKLLKFYCVCGWADDAREAFDSIPKRNLDTFSWIAMITGCGNPDEAFKVFSSMEKPNVFVWTSMIEGFLINGRFELALELFKEMQGQGLKLNPFTLIVVLSACSHGGLVDMGLEIFESMKERFGFEPCAEHNACIVDMLGRGGRLNEAENLIERMEVPPTGSILASLLGACQVHCNVKLGEKLAMKLFRLDLYNETNYVILSNIYASAGRWDDVGRVRRLMAVKGLSKRSGFSWIEIKNNVFVFGAHDQSNSEFESIYRKLEELNYMIIKAGYVPSTKCVLLDVEEDDKKRLLRSHSERLAIAFGLLKATPNVPIRISKNLRICGDCHDAIKLISKVEDADRLMEIIKQAAKEGALVLYTLADPSMAESAKQACKLWGVPSTDILRPTIEAIAAHIGVAPSGIPRGAPGRNPLTKDYFKRIEAIEFTIKQDDGALPQNLNRAHIVLVGVSRTGKTPLSIYLAQKGYKVANVPIVMGVDSPKSLFDINQEKIYGLTINPAVLQTIRKARAKTLGLKGDMMSNYSDMEHVREELEFAKRIFARNPVWPVIEITGKAIEETAAVIVRIYHDRKKKCFLPRISKRY